MAISREESDKLPKCVLDCFRRGLHNKLGHPICTTKHVVQDYFKQVIPRAVTTIDDLSPVVTVADNFDRLLTPKDHPSRSHSDSFYLSGDRMLRTHTSAHQCPLLSAGHRDFCVTGDVYRRDTVDRTHYPVFHQLEGITVLPSDRHSDPLEYLRELMIGLACHLFPHNRARSGPDVFPFTEDPGLEIEVEFDDRWLEILGCGVVHHRILEDCGVSEPLLAWGLGLDRLAMIMYKIPDIRLLWSDEPAFVDQFRPGVVTKFEPFSLLDAIHRDISFWIPEDDMVNGLWSRLNRFHEIARDQSALIESVVLYDSFFHRKRDAHSATFRLTFKPACVMRDGARLAVAANGVMLQLAELVSRELNVIIR